MVLLGISHQENSKKKSPAVRSFFGKCPLVSDDGREDCLAQCVDRNARERLRPVVANCLRDDSVEPVAKDRPAVILVFLHDRCEMVEDARRVWMITLDTLDLSVAHICAKHELPVAFLRLAMFTSGHCAS